VASRLRDGEQDRRILLFATGARTERGPVLKFTMLNVSNEPLAFYRNALPWGNPNSLQVAVITEAGVPLEIVFPIADPPPPERDEPITLAPGNSLAGEYGLAWVLGGRKRSSGSGLVVPWVFTVHTANSDSRTTISGVALVGPEHGP
jgi:hypothetical protein